MVLKNTQDGFGWVSQVVHWLSAALILGLFFLGYWMVDLNYYSSWYQSAPMLHVSIGVVLVVLTLLRIIWLQIAGKPQPHGDGKLAAKLGHLGLYVLLIAVLLTGYLISSSDGRPIDFFGAWQVPTVDLGIADQADRAGELHKIFAYIMMALVALHTLAACWHHFILKDDTLMRMLKNTKLRQ